MGKELPILGDFNGHLGYIGTQKLDKNGRLVLDLTDKYNLIFLNDLPHCEGKVTLMRDDKKNSTGKRSRPYFSKWKTE